MVLLVMRRVQTRSAFLALKLTEIMKRPQLMKMAAKSDKVSVYVLLLAQRVAFVEIEASLPYILMPLLCMHNAVP